jgi:hypothetical protein
MTPILRHRTRRNKVSVISGLSVRPVRQRLGLSYCFYPHNISPGGSGECGLGQVDVAAFLRPASASPAQARDRPVRQRQDPSACSPTASPSWWLTWSPTSNGLRRSLRLAPELLHPICSSSFLFALTIALSIQESIVRDVPPCEQDSRGDRFALPVTTLRHLTLFERRANNHASYMSRPVFPLPPRRA